MTAPRLTVKADRRRGIEPRLTPARPNRADTGGMHRFNHPGSTRQLTGRSIPRVGPAPDECDA